MHDEFWNQQVREAFSALFHIWGVDFLVNVKKLAAREVGILTSDQAGGAAMCVPGNIENKD